MRRVLLAGVLALEVVGVLWSLPAWRSEVTFWTQAVQDAPAAVAPRANLAVVLGVTGQGAAARQASAAAWRRWADDRGSIVTKASAAYVLVALDAALTAPARAASTLDGWMPDDRRWLAAVHRPFWWHNRPLTLASLAVEAAHDAPMEEYRLVNLLLHLSSAALIVTLGRRLSVSWASAIAAAAVWLLLPWHVETVMTLGGRGELFAALGLLAACLALEAKAWTWGVVALLAALASKESAIVALVLVPLWWTLGRWKGLPLAGLALLVAMSLSLRHAANLPYLSPDTWIWAREQATALGLLVARAWHPPVYVEVRQIALVWQTAALVGVILTGLLVSLRLLRWPMWTALGAGWVLVALLPRFLVSTPEAYLHAHHLYVPSIGVAWLLMDRRV